MRCTDRWRVDTFNFLSQLIRYAFCNKRINLHGPRILQNTYPQYLCVLVKAKVVKINSN